MKKYLTVCILLSLVVLVAAGCSKTPTGAAPTQNVRTVTYSLSAANTASYTVTYTTSNGNTAVETINGTSWSKSVDISDITVTKAVTLSAASPSINITTVVTLTMSMGNTTLKSGAYTFSSASNNGSISYSF